MNSNESTFQSPPPGSALSLERSSSATMIFGRSQGIPLRFFSPDDLGVMEKVLRMKEKLTSGSTEKSIGDLLAEQVFEWSLNVAGNRVTLTSKSMRRETVFNVGDVKKVYASDNGYLVAELGYLEEGKAKAQILTGALSATDSSCFFGWLVQLFNLDEQGVAKPQAAGSLKANPPESFTLVEQAGGSRLEIRHHTKLLHRLLPLVIGGTVLGLAGYGLLGDRVGGEGALPDLVKWVSDNPLWSQVVKYGIIAGLSFLCFKVVQIVFGTLKMSVSPNLFEMKRGIVGLGVTRSMSKSQMTGLIQTTWTKTTRDTNNHATVTRYWKLELKGDRTLTIFGDIMCPDDIDWLGSFLAEWFDIPFEKTIRKSRFS